MKINNPYFSILAAGAVFLPEAPCQETNANFFASLMTARPVVFQKRPLPVSTVFQTKEISDSVLATTGGDRNLSLFNRQKSAKPLSKDKDLPTGLLIAPSEKQFAPSFYYEHVERWLGTDEEADIFGKRWELSSRVALMFPACRWDYPSATKERVSVGIGISITLGKKHSK